MSCPTWVYILTNAHHTTLYVGSTSNLAERMDQHASGDSKSFTGRYNLTKLIWFEEFSDYTEAYAFERKLKRWRRDWKDELIEKMNPAWANLEPPLS